MSKVTIELTGSTRFDALNNARWMFNNFLIGVATDMGATENLIKESMKVVHHAALSLRGQMTQTQWEDFSGDVNNNLWEDYKLSPQYGQIVKHMAPADDVQDYTVPQVVTDAKNALEDLYADTKVPKRIRKSFNKRLKRIERHLEALQGRKTAHRPADKLIELLERQGKKLLKRIEKYRAKVGAGVAKVPNNPAGLKAYVLKVQEGLCSPDVPEDFPNTVKAYEKLDQCCKAAITCIETSPKPIKVKSWFKRITKLEDALIKARQRDVSELIKKDKESKAMMSKICDFLDDYRTEGELHPSLESCMVEVESRFDQLSKCGNITEKDYPEAHQLLVETMQQIEHFHRLEQELEGKQPPAEKPTSHMCHAEKFDWMIKQNAEILANQNNIMEQNAKLDRRLDWIVNRLQS